MQGIIVKVVTKKLGERYYKKKGVIQVWEVKQMWLLNHQITITVRNKLFGLTPQCPRGSLLTSKIVWR